MILPPPGRVRRDPFVRGLVLLVGIHSCALGSFLLFAPSAAARFFGFAEGGPAFFVSQGGIFLVVLGVCYLLALRRPVLVRVILVSKALAVPFLVAHAAFLSAPPAIWAAAAGDAAMLTALVAALRRACRAAGPAPPSA